ncbi:hypothetical protein D9V34_14530 [Mycetocola lacteus]|uniref:Uncharacterized protein n=1 Tax=Mycetocola lacteus TaxID=76637 RepID=A0A3L7AH12_9MICO|nr:hypothetical protein [Mycetocola lacteus]RLP79763.1 hypothetical protein D9V34_14530 [Mycetocola lacteus]
MRQKTELPDRVGSTPWLGSASMHDEGAREEHIDSVSKRQAWDSLGDAELLQTVVNSLGPWVSTQDVERCLDVDSLELAGMRGAHSILGVPLGPDDELFFPVQQFDPAGEIISGLPEVLEILDAIDPMTIATMLATPARGDDDRTVWDVLRGGDLPLAVDWARRTHERWLEP